MMNPSHAAIWSLSEGAGPGAPQLPFTFRTLRRVMGYETRKAEAL